MQTAAARDWSRAAHASVDAVLFLVETIVQAD